MGGAKIGLAPAVSVAVLLAAGCQTAPCDSCGYVETVAGNYREIAACVADAPIGDEIEEGAGVTVGTNQATGVFNAPQVVEDDPAARRIAIDISPYTETSYRLTFTGLTDRTTEVRGRPLGVRTEFFWPEEAGPLVARCSGRINR